ncbi:MAG TPA: protein kinase [Solirubrobacteraceae bacterium]|nr:protein kinase [Solirubrobacteraceae bacterium]
MSAVEIAGRYRLERRLGYGGMSTVHLAFDQRLERRVAVKLLAEHLAEEPTFVSRFQREAQAAARLVHPNIVQVFDSGLDPRSGQHFIVMEYIEGASCAEILRDRGWVQVDEAASIVEQACEGLHYAHRHGVVHRDVKPGNLLRSLEAEIKLADFGIAKATEQSSITQVGSVLGTAAYLAPEQARGEEAGPPADLYALGVVAYQLISGRLPYEAASLTELALKQQQEEPPMLDTLVAAASPELAEAVAIALALDPRDRYRDARDMGRAVHDAQRGIAPGESAHDARGAGGARARHTTAATSLLAPGAGGAIAGAAAGRGGGSARSGRPAQNATARTRALSRGEGVAPRQPRPGPAPRRAAPPAGGDARRGSSRARRLFAALFALLLLVVVVVALVVASAPGPTKVKLREVSYHDVEETSAALQQLVNENVK